MRGGAGRGRVGDVSAASDVSAQDLPERSPDTVRWLFADQLGPHFLDSPQQRVLLLESTDVFRRGCFHRRKAHLILSALRHRARDLGEQAQYVKAPTARGSPRRATPRAPGD